MTDKLKPYDVDPQTMTLEEIYGLPTSYFEPDTYTPHIPIPSLGIQYTRYTGHILREHGTTFFTIKEADPYVDHGTGHHGPCSWCTTSIAAQIYWPSALGDPEATRRSHP